MQGKISLHSKAFAPSSKAASIEEGKINVKAAWV
jgi:hypothetical protein